MPIIKGIYHHHKYQVYSKPVSQVESVSQCVPYFFVVPRFDGDRSADVDDSDGNVGYDDAGGSDGADGGDGGWEEFTIPILQGAPPPPPSGPSVGLFCNHIFC